MREQKAAKFKELKDEMMKAEQRKQEQKDKEAEEDWNIAKEQEEMEKQKKEQEEALRCIPIYVTFCRNISVISRDQIIILK